MEKVRGGGSVRSGANVGCKQHREEKNQGCIQTYVFLSEHIYMIKGSNLLI